MNQILKVAIHNLKMFFIKPWSILLLLSPILLSVLAQQFFGGESITSIGTIGVYVQDESSVTMLLKESLKEQKAEVLTYENEEEVRNGLQNDEILLGLIGLSTNSYEAVQKGDLPYKVIKKAGSQEADQILYRIQNQLGQFKLLMEKEEDERSFQEVYMSLKDSKFIMKQVDTVQQINTMIIVFSFFVMMFLLTVGVGLSPMISERESEVYNRICTTPIKYYEYVLGHLAGAFVIVFGQVFIQLVVMKLLKIDFNLGYIEFLIIGGVLGVVGLAISMLILAVSKTSTMYYMIMGIGVTPLCMLSDTFFPVEFFPEWLEKLSYLSPIRWIMLGYKGMIYSKGLEQIIGSLTIAVLISTVMVLISLAKKSHASHD